MSTQSIRRLALDLGLGHTVISLNRFRPQIVFSVSACAVYGSEDFSIQCLKQSGIGADAASHISQLIAEMSAAPNKDDNDSFFTSGGDEDEQTDC